MKSRLRQGQATSEAVLDPPLLLLASGGSLASLGFLGLQLHRPTLPSSSYPVLLAWLRLHRAVFL